MQRRSACSKDLFDGIETAVGRSSGARAASALHIQRDALHCALVELHSCQPRFLGNRGKP